MDSRSEDLTAFIQDNGWGDSAREVLAGDASNRRYDRLIDVENNRASVLMDAPPSKGENVREFVEIAAILRAYGFSAPEIYAVDVEKGFVLLEDLGDALVARVCRANPVMEIEMYEVAIDILVELHTHSAPSDLPIYDLAVYQREAALLTEWYLPAVSGAPVSPALSLEYDALIQDMCAPLQTSSKVLVQRDYHAENLLWLPGRDGLQRLGLLDFQDALGGHPAYDLVSLLEDARRDTTDALRNAMKQRYLTATGLNLEAFNYAYCALGAQRNLKILGIFTRLSVRDGKFTYPDLIPRVWDHLQRDLKHPALKNMKTWIDQNVPEPTPEILSKIRQQS